MRPRRPSSADASERPSGLSGRPSFTFLKRASFTHSAVYAVLLTAWAIPGLHGAEFVFGMAHGLGWFAMCGLCLAGLRARVISLRLAVAVAVVGAVGPFVGSAEFVREERARLRGANGG